MTDSQPEGYLALPPAEEGPGVLVLHAWWGLSEAIKDLCDRLAGEGFVAYAPDLYHGKLASTIQEAETLRDQLDLEEARAHTEVAEALDYISARAQPAEGGIGVVAFSLGAYFALQLSGNDPERVGAVVLFYGSGGGDFSRAKAAYLGHFAENDPYEPPEAVDWLEGALRSAGRPATFYRYPGVGHWFFEHDRPEAYNPVAASLAWDRTLAFLRSANRKNTWASGIANS
jgi:carboxymethylenebutenolidase